MVAKTGAERSKEYREKNEQGDKLRKLKYSVKTSKKRISDPAFDMEIKRKETGKISINGHLFRFLYFCCPGTFGKNAFLLW